MKKIIKLFLLVPLLLISSCNDNIYSKKYTELSNYMKEYKYYSIKKEMTYDDFDNLYHFNMEILCSLKIDDTYIYSNNFYIKFNRSKKINDKIITDLNIEQYYNGKEYAYFSEKILEDNSIVSESYGSKVSGDMIVAGVNMEEVYYCNVYKKNNFIFTEYKNNKKYIYLENNEITKMLASNINMFVELNKLNEVNIPFKNNYEIEKQERLFSLFDIMSYYFL